MWRKVLALAVFALLILQVSAFADQWVNGYYRRNGTYVRGYWRTDPDGYEWNNYSYRGHASYNSWGVWDY